MDALHDRHTLLALLNYGFIKFFKAHNMRRKIRLLEYLVGKWDPNIQVSQIGFHPLKILRRYISLPDSTRGKVQLVPAVTEMLNK